MTIPRQRVASVLFGLLNRVVYALLFGLVTWLFAWFPSPLADRQAFALLLRAINAPVAFVSLYLPFGWQAVDLVFGRNLPHSLDRAAYLWQHLRTAVPIYLLLFYSPNLVRHLHRRWSLRKEEDELIREKIRA